MQSRMEELADYILSQLENGRISSSVLCEFTDIATECIQKDIVINWSRNLSLLWDYLNSTKNSLLNTTDVEKEIRNEKFIFQQGQLFTVLEMLRMAQKKKAFEEVVKREANIFSNTNHKLIFKFLSNCESLTYKELLQQSKLSDDKLRAYISDLVSKDCLHTRQVGKTVYYRLSPKGQKICEMIQNN